MAKPLGLYSESGLDQTVDSRPEDMVASRTEIGELPHVSGAHRPWMFPEISMV